MTTRFNLSDWALKHRSMVWFMIMVSVVAGTLSYLNLGREEDPSFAIKTMVIAASLPGATASEIRDQVTDRIERKLQELPNLKSSRSESYPGRAVVYVDLTQDTRGVAVDQTWVRIRNMMGDIRGDFPPEFGGFTFNDAFGDVFGSIYAFTSDGFSPQELKDRVDDIRSRVLALPDSGKVELVGTQTRIVQVEFSARKLAALRLDSLSVISTLSQQNEIVPSGNVRSDAETIAVRVTGAYAAASDLAATPLRVGDTFFTLSDVATVTDGYADPPANLFRYNGKDAIGLAIGMRAGANILEFGAELDVLMDNVRAELPIGIDLFRVADQPRNVEESVNHFVKALIEAVAIVLGVSFVSLGVRAGLVVSLTIPLVLAITFIFLDMIGVTLQRISLGALIIALGLLVDDAMIAIETMISRLELGETRLQAASYAWTSIAFSMLTGTLVTVAGFIPIGLNSSQAGEYTISLFYVIAISLVVSWVVAVLFAPLLGVTLLPKSLAKHAAEPGRLRRGFRSLLEWVMRAKWLTIAATLAVFGGSLFGMRFVEQQFFPASDRPELLIDINMRQNSNITGTDTAIHGVEAWLATRPEVSFWSTYVGRSAPRFLLSLEGPSPTPAMGQIVVMTDSVDARDSLRHALADYAATLPGIEVFAKLVELGPPVGKPVQYRVSGPDRNQLLPLARAVASAVAADTRTANITLDEGEPTRVVRVKLDQERMRQLGLTQKDVAQVLQTLLDGISITAIRDGNDLIQVVARGTPADRQSISALTSVQLNSATGAVVPLAAIATFEWDIESPVLHQRDRIPTITVKAAVAGKDQPTTIVRDLAPSIAALSSALPAGYAITVAGVAESSSDSMAPILAIVPVMLLIMLSLVMVQMQSFRLMFVVLAVAPLGLIGVVAALVPSGAPLGFVAILGVLALIGILIRNAIILVHEIEVLADQGRSRWDAVLEASDSRARPILLTAAAASLALIPISREVFWGPMAYSLMGGIIAGTLITLLFAPALYCAVFGLTPPNGPIDTPTQPQTPAEDRAALPT